MVLRGDEEARTAARQLIEDSLPHTVDGGTAAPSSGSQTRVESLLEVRTVSTIAGDDIHHDIDIRQMQM